MQPGKWEISEAAGEWRPSAWLHVCVGNEANDEAGEQRAEIPPWGTSSTRALTLSGPSHSHGRLIGWSFRLFGVWGEDLCSFEVKVWKSLII